MGKSTTKSYDEKMRDLQRKMAELKKDRKEKDRKHTYAIGAYIVRMIPGLLDMFEEDFDLEAFLTERLIIKESSGIDNTADASSDEKLVEESAQNVTEETKNMGKIAEVFVEKKTAEMSEAKVPVASSTGNSSAKTASLNNHVQHVMMEQSDNSAVGQLLGNNGQGT